MHLWPFNTGTNFGTYDLKDELDSIDLDVEFNPCRTVEEVDAMVRYYFLFAAEDKRIHYFEEHDIKYSDTFRDEIITICRRFRDEPQPEAASRSSSDLGDATESEPEGDEPISDDFAVVDEPDLLNASEMANADTGRALRTRARTGPPETTRSPLLGSRQSAPSRTMTKHHRAKKTFQQPIATRGNNNESGDDDDDAIPSKPPATSEKTSKTDCLQKMKRSLN